MVTRAETGSFADNHVRLMKTFADQAVIAIENVRLFNETREALERETSSAEILRVISSSPTDVQPVFDVIVASLLRLFGTQFAAVQLVREASVTMPAVGGKQGFERLAERFPRPLDDTTIGGLVMLSKQTRQFLAQEDPVTPDGTQRFARDFGFNSVLATPMIHEGQVIGCIITGHPDAKEFDTRQIALIETFARQAVIAIENVRLFNETQEALERQTATADILKVIASSPDDVQPVFEAIVANAARLIGGFSAGVFRFVDGAVHLAAITSLDPAGDEAVRVNFPRPIGDDAYSVPQAGKVLAIADTEDYPDKLLRNVARVRGFRSVLYVPLRSSGTSIGTIVVTRRTAGPFAAHHVDLLQTFADQAVIAIENVRLFSETKEALERQTATADILKVIASSPDDVQPVFEAIAERSNQLVNGLATAVYRRVDDMVHLMAFTPVNPAADAALRAAFPAPVSLFRWTDALEKGEAVVIADAEVEFAAQPAILALSRLRGWRSSLATPLMRDGQAVGVITVTRAEPGGFDDHHVQLLKTFADQAVIAISNVGLFNEVQAKTRDLTEALTYQTGSANILSVIASSPTDVGPVLKAIVESACELCGAYDAFVLLKDGDNLRTSAHHGPIPFQEKWPVNRNWAAGRAFLDQKPVHVRDFLSEEGDDFADGRELARRMGFRTALVVPLLREGESIGVVALRRTEVHPFSDKQIALLQTFADQAVIAIENVRLFDEVQARTGELSQSVDELRALGEVSQAVNSTVDLETVLNTIVAKATQLSSTEAGAIYVFDDERAGISPARNVMEWTMR